MNTLIKDITIINEGLSFQGSLLIKDELIEGIIDSKLADYPLIRHQWESTADKVIDGKDSFLIPGVIDDQVHFREPGATQKGDIERVNLLLQFWVAQHLLWICPTTIHLW